MLKLRSIGIRHYRVLEGGQRIGRIRFADERMPGVWLWNVTIHLSGGLPRPGPRLSLLAAAYRAMNIRDAD
jgi:hypothetical protein